jgi:flagellar protein FliJ
MTTPEKSTMNTTLHLVLAHAERQRDEALAAMLLADETVRRLRTQADQLEAYRSEYRARGPASTGVATGIDALRRHADFMQRLEQALAQQALSLQSAQANAARQRTELVAQEMRVASARKLLERRTAEQQRAQTRLEQRRTDEAALQQLWRRHADHAPTGH